MKTLNITRFLALTVLAGTAAQAAPFLAISDNAEVFLLGTLGVRSDSNIYLSSKATSDTITNLDVGAELKFGTRSTANGFFSVVDSFTNYSSHSRLNSNLGSARLVTNYDDGKLKLGFNASFIETKDNQTDTVNGDFLVGRSTLSVGGNAELAVSEKTKVGGGFDYVHTDYRKSGYADSDIVTVPFNYYMEITPKVDLSVGYRYRNTAVSIGSDSRDDYFNVGSRGQFTPKLSGQFTVGLNRRTLAIGGTQSQLGATSNFSYAYSPKTSMNFGVTNDFGTTGQGQQNKSLTYNASVQSNVSEEWSVNLGISHRTIEYATKTDHYVEGQVGTTYTVNANIRITASYAHRNNASPLATGEFTGDVFSLAANFRY
jgi:hypothetical protein